MLTGATGSVVGLNAYPVKSCAGVSVAGLTLTKDGLFEFPDRRYAVVPRRPQSGENGEEFYPIITQRTHQQLVTVIPSVGAGIDGLKLHYGTRGITLPLQPDPRYEQVTIQLPGGSKCAGRKFGKAAQDFFTEVLGVEADLVHFSKVRGRITRNTNQLNGDSGDDGRHLEFADQYPVSLLFMSTLRRLQERARLRGFNSLAVTPDLFRMNITVEWDFESGRELLARTIQIGQVVLRIAAPCFRCSMINYSQTDGLKIQPEIKQGLLGRVLVQDFMIPYLLNNQEARKPWMGLYCTVDRPGLINRGDPVTVLEWGESVIIENIQPQVMEV